MTTTEWDCIKSGGSSCVDANGAVVNTATDANDWVYKFIQWHLNANGRRLLEQVHSGEANEDDHRELFDSYQEGEFHPYHAL